MGKYETGKIGTPLLKNACKLLLLGNGELGKEVLIEAMRMGVETIAVDSYENAPAQQIANRHYVIDMKDGNALRAVVEREQPDFIVPEIEALDTEELERLEKDGYHVVPTAHAARLTMDREGIRRLAAETIGLPTAKYKFAQSLEEFKNAVMEIGIPCVTKPIMSSSGKGQSVIKNEGDIEPAFEYARSAARGNGQEIIVEEFIKFDYEITLLTVRTAYGTKFCEPIGHVQVNGDYLESWQPATMKEETKEKARKIAKDITDALGGYGIFGVEMFVCGDRVIFSEVSPRPHDTGMVTMMTQRMSEFELHLRAILGLPVDTRLMTPGASHVIKAEKDGWAPLFDRSDAVKTEGTKIRLFGKPLTKKGRRMGVVIAEGNDTDEARKIAKEAVDKVRITY